MNNFTPRAEQLLRIARKCADDFGIDHVDVPHIAFALLELQQGVHFHVWQRIGFDQQGFRARIEDLLRARGTNKPVEGNIPYTPALKKLLARAGLEARRLDHAYVGTEHILLALIAFGDATSDLLQGFGLDHDQVEDAVLYELDPNFIPSRNPPEPVFDPTTLASQVGFHVLIDPGSATAEQIVDVLHAISDVNRAAGGEGLMFIDSPDESKILTGSAA